MAHDNDTGRGLVTGALARYQRGREYDCPVCLGERKLGKVISAYPTCFSTNCAAHPGNEGSRAVHDALGIDRAALRGDSRSAPVAYVPGQTSLEDAEPLAEVGPAEGAEFTETSLAKLTACAVSPEHARSRGVLPVRHPDHVPDSISRFWVIGTGGSRGPGMLFNWTDGDRVVPQFRPDKPVVKDDGEEAKYIFPKDCGTFLWHLREGEPGAPVIFCEGALKALAVDQWAPPEYGVVAFPGAQSWYGTDLSWAEGRKVALLFDADITSNPQVYDAATEAKDAFDAEGAEDVVFVTLPGAKGKDGIDDVLGRRDADKRTSYLANLVSRASQSPGKRPAKKKPAPRTVAGTASETDGVSQHRGQLRMAERFVSEHADELRHVHRIGWHEWDGARWKMDEERADLRAAVNTVKAALVELATMNGQDRDDMYEDVRRSESAAGLEGMAKIASALQPISTSPNALDADPYLFNTPEGTADLRNGEIGPNDRSHLITRVAGGGIGDASSDEWERFLKRILPDPDVRAFVQRLFGYAMLGKVTEHVMPIFTGTGANGKGTLRDAVMAAFGDYALEMDPALLMESKHERHGAFKMRMRGARLVFCSETEKGRKFAEATMKRLVGGDPIEANYMHKNPITFDPSHTLIMLTNHLPAVSGDDPAVWRRILVVPFDVVIPEAERDGGLPERLKAASDAVLAWIYQGWIDYREQGLNPPDAVRARTEAYQAESDALGRFLAERTLTNAHGFVKARELFTAWTDWCHATGLKGEDIGTEVTFAASLKLRGYEKKRSAAGQTYRGLLLTGDEPEEDGPRNPGGCTCTDSHNPWSDTCPAA